MNNGERKLKIKELEHQIGNLQSELYQLINDCPHNIVKYHDSANCNICGKGFGWWCPKSPTHLCKYSRSMDSCDYCGEPEERK